MGTNIDPLFCLLGRGVSTENQPALTGRFLFHEQELVAAYPFFQGACIVLPGFRRMRYEVNPLQFFRLHGLQYGPIRKVWQEEIPVEASRRATDNDSYSKCWTKWSTASCVYQRSRGETRRGKHSRYCRAQTHAEGSSGVLHCRHRERHSPPEGRI